MNTSQQHFPVFSAIYSDTCLRRNIHSTYSRTTSLKNREEFYLRSTSHLFTSTTEETSCKPLRRLTKTKKMLFLRQENSATPIKLHFKELCGGFYPYTWVSKPEMRAMRTIDLMLLLLKLNVIFTATFS